MFKQSVLGSVQDQKKQREATWQTMNAQTKRLGFGAGPEEADTQHTPLSVVEIS
jgi:hypothetical protein